MKYIFNSVCRFKPTAIRYYSSVVRTPQSIPEWLITELRTDHAGETGAVSIYYGAQVAGQLRGHSQNFMHFVKSHLETEETHLKIMNDLLLPSQKTKLLPLWKILGFTLGFVPTLISEKQMYNTTTHIESYVVSHLQSQINRLNCEKYAHCSELRAILIKIRRDEEHHKNQSYLMVDLQPDHQFGFIQRMWSNTIFFGSRTAVALSRRI